MPFVEGESLRDRLQREKQLSIEDALALTRDIASALAHAHSQGVVHRDIKPENVQLIRETLNWLDKNAGPVQPLVTTH